MASDQIEYCGNCTFYEKCKKLAEEDRLDHCQHDEMPILSDEQLNAYL